MQGPSADELLAHAGFVRRIAESMLRDGNDVEDVVQETYLAALKAPPRRGLRAWLGVVARNAARMRQRGERRRVAHCGTVKTDDDGYAQLRNVTAGRRYRSWGSAAPGVTFMADTFVAEDGAVVTLRRN